MKRIVSVFTLMLVIASMFVLGAFADDYDMTIAVATTAESRDLKVGDTFEVSATVTNINDPLGLAVLEYNIVYDKTVLELTDVEHKLPDIWEKYVDDEDHYVNLSNRDDDPESAGKDKAMYVWAMVTTTDKIALHEGGKLSIVLKFKVIAEGKASIEFIPQTNTNDNFGDLTANNVAVNLQIGDIDAQNSGADDSQKTVDISGSVGEVSANGKSYVVWIIVGLVVLFAAVLGCVYFFARKKQK